MKARIFIVSMAGFLVLPSCMSPMQQALRARAEQKQRAVESEGRIAMGASDDVGSYMAGTLFDGRLTLDAGAQVSSAR